MKPSARSVMLFIVILSGLQHVVALEENLTVVYEISVKTCDERYAGTDADVFIQIYGQRGKTAELELTKSGNLFERGSTDNFQLLAKYVGQISKIEVKRNTKGPFDGWKLCEIMVKALQPLNRRFAFNQWIPDNEWVESFGGK